MRYVGMTTTEHLIEGVERPTYLVRGLACSLVVLGQAMFWCVGTFQDSRPIPRSLVRRTGAPARTAGGGRGCAIPHPAPAERAPRTGDNQPVWGWCEGGPGHDICFIGRWVNDSRRPCLIPR
jgi:hypothetical protein